MTTLKDALDNFRRDGRPVSMSCTCEVIDVTAMGARKLLQVPDTGCPAHGSDRPIPHDPPAPLPAESAEPLPDFGPLRERLR